MKYVQSQRLWQEAQQFLAGGVNSPVRAFKAVGGDPFFVVSGDGSRITDADGNEYIDYVLSWGPLVLGHAHPHVVERVGEALAKGASFGIPTEAEIRLAELVAQLVPGIEKLRLVNSGTEASMSAIRLARGVTGRDYIVKMEGCYHGHVDGLLVKAGSGLTTLGVPSSPGVPEGYAQYTLTLPYNDLEATRQLFAEHGDRIACLIVEPVPGNMGVVLPEPGYLEGLREITKQHGALLIFDEVMSGFRVSLACAQGRYGVTPDITVLGKVIGGGLPVGAYGASAEIMDQLSPVGPIYQAGTLSGNPLATAAGLATLELLVDGDLCPEIEGKARSLGAGLGEMAEEAGVPIWQTQAGSMSCMFFTDKPVKNYADATASDTKRYAKFFRGMLERGVYFAPSQFEAAFMSIAHSDSDLNKTIEAAGEVFKTL